MLSRLDLGVYLDRDASGTSSSPAITGYFYVLDQSGKIIKGVRSVSLEKQWHTSLGSTAVGGMSITLPGELWLPEDARWLLENTRLYNEGGSTVLGVGQHVLPLIAEELKTNNSVGQPWLFSERFREPKGYIAIDKDVAYAGEPPQPLLEDGEHAECQPFSAHVVLSGGSSPGSTKLVLTNQEPIVLSFLEGESVGGLLFFTESQGGYAYHEVKLRQTLIWHAAGQITFSAGQIQIPFVGLQEATNGG